MSRIGKRPILLPAGVKVIQNQANISVQGPKGMLSMEVPQGVEVMLEGNAVIVKKTSDNRKARSYFGLTRTLVDNMVTGVSAGFEKKLEISGVGYRAEASRDRLKLVVGYSSPSEYVIPEGIAVKVDKLVNIVVSGIDKQMVGRVAAEIRALRKPEPYKGKGIRYVGEQVRRKVGKSVGS
jgi:large subunit ribosomal protein L6